jgi:hypothetical protein
MFQQQTNPYQRQKPYYPQNPANASNNGINWVQGIEGAKAWFMSPNSNVILMDSENDGIFYIKVSDNVGMCNLRTFRYTEITGQVVQKPEPQIDLSEYVKKSELESLINSMLGGVKNEQSVSRNDGKSSAESAKR